MSVQLNCKKVVRIDDYLAEHAEMIRPKQPKPGVDWPGVVCKVLLLAGVVTVAAIYWWEAGAK